MKTCLHHAGKILCPVCFSGEQLLIADIGLNVGKIANKPREFLNVAIDFIDYSNKGITCYCDIRIDIIDDPIMDIVEAWVQKQDEFKGLAFSIDTLGAAITQWE
jgi:hypothetical protein